MLTTLQIKRGALLLLTSIISMASVAEESSASSLSIDESIVMFYYKDISLVKGFYEDLLQLNKTLDDEWVKIYQITPSSSVGIVQESDAGHHKTQANNAVMLSIVTDDVDAWYKRFKSSKDSVFLKDIYNNEHAPIRAFLVADPGGYTVEIFQWLNR